MANPIPLDKLDIYLFFALSLRKHTESCPRWNARWNEGVLQMAQWIREGKIKAQETVVEGFENIPDAMSGLFTGANTGKMIVKL